MRARVLRKYPNAFSTSAQPFDLRRSYLGPSMTLSTPLGSWRSVWRFSSNHFVLACSSGPKAASAASFKYPAACQKSVTCSSGFILSANVQLSFAPSALTINFRSGFWRNQ